jgi:hypothetical protein
MQQLSHLGQYPDTDSLQHGLAAIRRRPATPGAALTDADLIAAFC